MSLLSSPQIKKFDQLLDQSVIGKKILHSQPIMVTNANANGFTHLSCSQREDTMFDDTWHKRDVNVVLVNLVCLHYPSEVCHRGNESSAATYWDDYVLSPDATYGNAQGIVWSDFWVTFFRVLFLMPYFGNA
jgi:hypothetical protein